MSQCSSENPNIEKRYKCLIALSIALTGCVDFIGSDAVNTPERGKHYQMVTGDESIKERAGWDSIYNTRNYVFGKEPSTFLKENIGLLPVGKALDLAMGEGRNAVYLAKKGFRVVGVDISEVALRKARRLAKEQRVQIETVNADLNVYEIPPNHFDLIVDIQFLSRPLIPKIIKGLKRNGIVVFENHTVDQIKNGKTIPKEYLLEKGELRKLFSDLKILKYEETNDGKDAMARLIAIKP